MFSIIKILFGKRVELCLVLFAGSISFSYGQQENKISGLCMVREKSIVLRWVPASVPVWQTGIKYGYVIKKHIIAKDGIFIEGGLNKSELLTKVPVKPKSSEFFDSLSIVDKRASIVQEVVYGSENLLAPNSDFKSFMKDYEDRETRFGFALFMCDLSADIAKAAGLQFTDTNIRNGERYVYSIELANIPDGLTIEPAIIIADAGILTQLPPVIDIRAIFLDKAVKFRWQITQYKGIYSAYLIEKSLDGKKFSPVSDLPVVNFTEVDDPDFFSCSDSLDNGTETYYRIRGISPFGETGPPSDIISGKGIPEFSAYCSIDTAIVNDGKQATIKWRVSGSSASTIKGINIIRSASANGPYGKLNTRPLQPKSQDFTDKNPIQTNYYKVVLTGEGDRISSSFPYFVQLEDNDPPLPPEFVSGTVDSSGKVTLLWKENKEADLLGYKIFRSNSRDDEFIALDQGIISRNICYDSINLNTLAQKICYQAIAIDKNYNSSDYSAVLELSRPDTIPPSPALIKRIDVSDGKAVISFEGSPAIDISEYALSRQSQDDTVKSNLNVWSNELPDVYEDAPSIQGRIQIYTLITTDKSGNRSENSRRIYIPSSSSKKIVVMAEQAKDGRTISLKWILPGGFAPVKTVVYRGTDSEPVSIYKTLAGTENYFTDNETVIGAAYTYRLILYDRNNDVLSSDKLRVSPAEKSGKAFQK